MVYFGYPQAHEDDAERGGYILAVRGQLDEAGGELERCIEVSRARGDHTYLPPRVFHGCKPSKLGRRL